MYALSCEDATNIFIKPGLDRYLNVCAEEIGALFDAKDRDAYAESYESALWRSLKTEQEFAEFLEGIEPDPIHPPWSAERAAFLAAEFEGAAIDAERRAMDEVDIHDSVDRAAELARKQGIVVGSEALAYAADRLQSKIERGAVNNPVNVAHDSLLSHRFQKEMADGGNVVYLDRYKRGREEQEQREREERAKPQQQPQPQRAEPMFKRIGLLKAQAREWLVRGFLGLNEVGNPFGKPDSFKGVSAAQLCVHIAGGVPFLGMAVKQMPTAYFAAERGEQAKRRIKGHVQRLGLPEDLPCYYGDRPINLLDDKDVKLLLEEITAIERDAGCPLGLLVIDTQSRTLAGDENSTKDGAKYAAAIELLRRHTSSALWIIAHLGHAEDAQDRPRGNSSLLGAYDTFYKYAKKDENHGFVKITIDRDGLGQKVIHFVVELYDTGDKNTSGEPVMVPWIEIDDRGVAAAGGGRRRSALCSSSRSQRR